MNLTVACVNHGNYLGQGQRYVDTLRAMVSRHLQRKHDFVCLEDVGKYSGWWAKIELFRPGRFSGRVLYLDLDSVVVGDLAPIVDAKGIINLLDWGWQTPTLCSSVMCWDAGEHKSIFELFDASVPQAFRGDQDWMTHLGGWKALPKGLAVSYRYESVQGPPAGASMVNMHGLPKPHEITTGWVPRHWSTWTPPSAPRSKFAGTNVPCAVCGQEISAYETRQYGETGAVHVWAPNQSCVLADCYTGQPEYPHHYTDG